MYYYSLKIHTLAWQRPAKMPWIEGLVVSSAAENDLTIFKENYSQINNRIFYGDKIYHNKPWFEDLYLHHNSEMLTPVKAIKGMAARLRSFDKAADNIYSKAVSVIRQPIESLFK